MNMMKHIENDKMIENDENHNKKDRIIIENDEE